MKTLKHVFAIVLTIALLFALAAPAFADGTIEVLNPGSHEYKAYKIFDVAEDNGELKYTATDDHWKTAINDALEAGELQGLTIDETTGVVTKLPTFKAAEFAAWAKENTPSTETATFAADADGKMVTGAVDNGYYLVVPDSGDRASLVTVFNKDVTVQNKNDMPFDKKAKDGNAWVDESGVQLGQVVEFKITGVVPDTTNNDSFVYIVHDKLSEGLTLDVDSIVVKIADTEVDMQTINDPDALLTGDQLRLVKENGEVVGFELSLDMNLRGKTDDTATPEVEGLDLAGEAVEITYSATVNENAVNVISQNLATLEYGDENGITSKDSETRHYTSSIVIDKFETGSPESKVAGAKFVLKNADDKYYKLDNGVVTWVAEADAEEVETTADGSAEFIGLPDGDYQLIETEAPTGYTQLTSPIDVTVNGEAATALGLSDAQIVLALSKIVHVANTPGSLLPSTGGIGTTIFYVVGGLLVLAAIAVILISSRKKQAKSN